MKSACQFPTFQLQNGVIDGGWRGMSSGYKKENETLRQLTFDVDKSTVIHLPIVML